MNYLTAAQCGGEKIISHAHKKFLMGFEGEVARNPEVLDTSV